MLIEFFLAEADLITVGIEDQGTATCSPLINSEYVLFHCDYVLLLSLVGVIVSSGSDLVLTANTIVRVDP
ncbi:MAG: hypothetical protein PsegKO_24340 [Pseudohongiellaceae bacterium]